MLSANDLFLPSPQVTRRCFEAFVPGVEEPYTVMEAGPSNCQGPWFSFLGGSPAYRSWNYLLWVTS